MFNHDAETVPEALGVSAEAIADAANLCRRAAAEMIVKRSEGRSAAEYAMEMVGELPRVLQAAVVALNVRQLNERLGYVEDALVVLPVMAYMAVKGDALDKFSRMVEELVKIDEDMLRALALSTSMPFAGLYLNG